MITSKNYVSKVLRTESTDMQPIKARLQNNKCIRLLHAGMGLCTEAAEFVDALKKWIFYGKELDNINLKEEIGDTAWYVALAVDVLNTTFDEVLSCNIAKLKKRYPEKFTSDAAINRDVTQEMTVFTKECDANTKA